jgi:amino acid transporter
MFKRGNVGAITLVLSGVTIIIGVLVFSMFSSAIPTAGLTASATNAINNVTFLFYQGIQLLAVGIIILAAAIVLGYLFMIRG